MATQWTEQQKNAIDIRNSSVIVSAAAGSGKTAVLTERLSRLIADESAGVRADRIIAVTFTNDAASELRKRLDSKLRGLLLENPADRYLLKQQTLLQSAKISTINAFCFEILRDNIDGQGITSGFTVLDEQENELICSGAMDRLIDYYCVREYDKISFMYDKFCLKNSRQLAEIIRLADKYLSSSAMRDRWLESAVSAFDAEPAESVYFKTVLKSAMADIEKAEKLAERRCALVGDIFSDMKLPAAAKYNAQAEDELVHVKKARELLESGSIPDKENIEKFSSFPRLVTVRRSEDIDETALDRCNALRNEIKKLVSEALSGFLYFSEDYSESRQVTEILAEMLRKYHSLIWEKKCEKNAISFDDGERLVLELLADIDESGRIVQSETAAAIADYYDIIMIDEYQDSNNKEDLIFKLLSKNYHFAADGTPMYGTNAFLVGDAKQSIYRFRLANPENFITTLKNSVPYSSRNESGNYSVFLNKNFRSARSVIDTVNYVFSGIMSEECGDIEYNSDEQLYFGAAGYDKYDKPEQFHTDISFINIDAGDDDDDNNDEDGEEAPEIEAAYTAGKIYSMLSSQVPVIAGDGTSRPCRPSDFCVLIRKNKYSARYIKELGKLGIEAKGEEEKGYLKSEEISVLTDLLRIIDNPLLDVPMTAVMMSPMYAFELQEIAQLKALDTRRHLYAILNNLVHGDYADFSDDDFVKRCRDFLEALSRFRLLSVTMNIGELIGAVYDDTDFLSVMQLYKDGEKKRANLRALIQYAKSYESSSAFEGTGSLSGFVRYIDRIIENGGDFPQSRISTSTGDYVSVKTIHKSKGLEYPFIFLAETASMFRFDHPPVLFSDDGRIGYMLYDQKLARRYCTGAYRQIRKHNKRETLSEEMRLLYVAMTRAKQKLFINLAYNGKKLKSVQKLLENYYIEDENLFELADYAVCHADWIWMSLFEYGGFDSIADKIGLIDAALPEAKCSGDFIETEFPQEKYSDRLNSHDESSGFSEAAPDTAAIRELREIISFDYDMTLSKTPAKLSVTQLAGKLRNKDGKYDFKLKRPNFMSGKTKLTGAERGTAIHTFFQYCDFENARADFDSELSEMIDKGYLSVKQAESIDRENVAAFFRSGLYQRMKNSPKVYREKKFMAAVADLGAVSENIAEISDGMIKGIIDMAFEENGSLVIVDYKSDRGASAEKLAERYKPQLTFYKLAMELTSDMPVSELYLYSFELQKEIRIK